MKMLKLIVGVKGTGKTKMLIESANAALEKTDGCVVVIEKGTKLIHEIKYQERLLDTKEYEIVDAESLYGFIAGIYASNHDVTHIYIDSAYKICNNDIASFAALIEKVSKFGEDKNIEFFITSSIPVEEIPESLKKFIA